MCYKGQEYGKNYTEFAVIVDKFVCRYVIYYTADESIDWDDENHDKPDDEKAFSALDKIYEDESVE